MSAPAAPPWRVRDLHRMGARALMGLIGLVGLLLLLLGGGVQVLLRAGTGLGEWNILLGLALWASAVAAWEVERLGRPRLACALLLGAALTGLATQALLTGPGVHSLALAGGALLVVLAGAQSALFAACQCLLDPGDEVVMFEPYFDSYAAAVAMAGGVRRVVPLVLVDGAWGFDPDALRAAITPRTKLLLINTPHNPTGKVLTRAESEQIAAVAPADELERLVRRMLEPDVKAALPPASDVVSPPGSDAAPVLLACDGSLISVPPVAEGVASGGTVTMSPNSD